jgi:hypothetical protein
MPRPDFDEVGSLSSPPRDFVRRLEHVAWRGAAIELVRQRAKILEIQQIVLGQVQPRDAYEWLLRHDAPPWSTPRSLDV